MKTLTILAALAIAAGGASGCAGGWRNGGPTTAGTTGVPAAKAAPAAAGNQASEAGVTFVWKGDASSVHVAGGFNDWSTTADPLAKQADGTWSITKKIAPGSYPYKFVIDGGTWQEDPNAKETVDDGYGGKNSLVVVAAGAGAAAAPKAAPAAAAKPKQAAPAGNAAGVTLRWTGAAASVHLAGEFNDWSTTADPFVKQADGAWSITKQLAPGRYAYKFVIDGGTWKEDPNATDTVDDGYGGKNSLLVVGGDVAGAAPAGDVAGRVLLEQTRSLAAGAAGAGRAPELTANGVRFFFAGAHRSVHLAGDFNGWSTTADPLLAGDGGMWTILRKLEPGTFHYKFVVNGSTWKLDEANPESVDDGFGGRNSVITVK